jgi:hypothetical protein
MRPLFPSVGGLESATDGVQGTGSDCSTQFMVECCVDNVDFSLTGNSVRVCHVDVAAEVDALEERVLGRGGADQGRIFCRGAGGRMHPRGFASRRGLRESESFGLKLCELETMKVGNVAQIEQASILGRGWRLLSFLGNRDEGVATIIMVGGEARAHAGGVLERNTTYQRTGSGLRRRVGKNVRLRSAETWRKVEFAEGFRIVFGGPVARLQKDRDRTGP